MTAEKVLLCIVSFLFPIVGIILWVVKKDEGKIYGIVGIASWILCFVSSMVISFASTFILGFLEAFL